MTRRFHRPAHLDPLKADELPGGADPATRKEAAHETARILLSRARAEAPTDPALLARLRALVETEGVETLAQLWADAPADSLPGALWRVYLLREHVRVDPTLADRYRLGAPLAEVPNAIAGAAPPPGPAELRALADAILTGVFTGDFGLALNRASAFARVLAVGSAADANLLDSEEAAARDTREAARFLTMSDDLAKAAASWKVGTLD